MYTGLSVPQVTFHTRIRDDSIGGENPFRWQDMTTDDFFKGKRVVLFALPGAFTPTCSNHHLPGYEDNAAEFKAQGIDEIYCMSVNDSFVMNKWAQDQDLKNVKVIPDGSGEFTRKIGMLVNNDGVGFGYRSWRYAAVVNDGVIEAWFEEPGRDDNSRNAPFGESSSDTVLTWLKANN